MECCSTHDCDYGGGADFSKFWSDNHCYKEIHKLFRDASLTAIGFFFVIDSYVLLLHGMLF